MHYRISKTLPALVRQLLTYKYVELMSLRCRLLTYGVVGRECLVVLAKLMTPKLTVLSPNYLRLRPLGRTVVMDRR